jgi:hypothetical protein
VTNYTSLLPSKKAYLANPHLCEVGMHNPRYRGIFVALKKELPRKLTTRESLALHRAVRLSLMAEVAGADPSVDLAVAVRLENASCRARAEWTRIAQQGSSSSKTPSLRKYLEQRHAQTA